MKHFVYDLKAIKKKGERMPDRLMYLSEAAEVMRCSYSKAQKIARAGKLPFRKIGANWVIAQSTLYRELGLSVGGEEGHESDDVSA